jgi:teichuronic acid exporter
MSLKNKVVKGISWSAAERFLSQLAQLAMTVFLARLLSPDDFGLVAILLVFIAISQSLIDCGLSHALIQKNNRSELDFSTVFHCNVVIGIFVYIIIYAVAPAVAKLYDAPELESLFRCLGLMPLLQGLSIIQVAKLTINVDFKGIAKASVVSIVISSIAAIYLASIGAGAWAIVVQLLLNSIINTSLLWFFVDWRPKLVFSKKSFLELFSFGWKLVLSGLLHSIYINSYNLVIGFKYSAADVGFFNQASVIARFPSIGFMAIISRAVFPIQCEIKDDKVLLMDSFKSHLQLSHFVIFPLMLGLAILSEPLISLILTDKWMPMASYFSLLCISYGLTPIMVANNQILLVTGRSDLFLMSELVKKAVGISILLATFPYGINAICLGFTVYSICDAAIGIFYSKKTIGVGYLKQFQWIYKSTLAAFIMAVIVYVSSSAFGQDWSKIIVGLLVGSVSYIYICHVLKIKLVNKILSSIGL